ncbi:MAG: YkgJ family cysteine cluster protein [Candidatus Eremiobacteraeota bacterium]|nr:YkgJ family cysteine cluster protein [Candidatus Eremiobacteraeota bacterium]
MKNSLLKLKKFFEDLEKHLSGLKSGNVECWQCGSCCFSHCLRMTMSNLEFELIRNYMEEKNIPKRVHFEPMDDRHLDKREGFSFWPCPMLKNEGCIIHPVRPLACRLFGYYRSNENPEVGERSCAFTDPIFFEIPPDLPFWEEYASILRETDFKMGYIFPDSLLYAYPILEVLTDFPGPLKRWTAVDIGFTKILHSDSPKTYNIKEWTFDDF